MPGPQETRLIQALNGARPSNVDTSAYEWSRCADILHSVSGRLDVAEMPIAAGEAGEKTAGAMNTAFKSAAAGMKERETKLRAGSQALAAAQTALDDAKSAHAALGAESAAPTYTPSEDPGSEAGIKHHNDYLAKSAAHQAEVDHRERVSREHADRLDKVLSQSSETMKEIHGEKDDDGRIPERPGPGGSGHHVPSTGGHGGGAPTVHLAGPDPGSGPGHGPGQHVNPGPGGHETNPTGPGVTYPPGGGTHEPGGGTIGTTPIGTTPIGTTPIGTSAGGGLPGTGLVAGATAGGVGAGLVGAGLTSGGLRGILPTGGTSLSPSTAQSAVRGIGTTSRAAGATTIGRSGVSAAGTTSGTGASSRSAGGAAGANRSGSSTRGSSSRSGGKAGGRSAGSAAGGRGGRRKDDDKSGKHDLFNVDEDWVDDEGAAPGVLD